jgi:hypothetical protein
VAKRVEELLWATEAARRLGISTEELLRLAYRRQIRYRMVDGIVHIPAGAIEEYRTRS